MAHSLGGVVEMLDQPERHDEVGWLEDSGTHVAKIEFCNHSYCGESVLCYFKPLWREVKPAIDVLRPQAV